MRAALQDYYDVRAANAFDLTVEQVKRLNALEETHNRDLAFTDAESRRLTGSSAYLSDSERQFDVQRKNRRVFVAWREEDWRWSAEVRPDGSLDYGTGA